MLCILEYRRISMFLKIINLIVGLFNLEMGGFLKRNWGLGWVERIKGF